MELMGNSITDWGTRESLCLNFTCIEGIVPKSQQKKSNRYNSKGGLGNQMHFNLSCEVGLCNFGKNTSPFFSSVSSSVY